MLLFLKSFISFRSQTLLQMMTFSRDSDNTGTWLSRSSRPEVFCKKGSLRNFAKFTGKHLCQGLLIKFQASACNFIKKETVAQVFCCEFYETSKNTFCYRTSLVAASGFLRGIFRTLINI